MFDKCNELCHPNTEVIVIIEHIKEQRTESDGDFRNFPNVRKLVAIQWIILALLSIKII